MKIWVDADACPVVIKDILYKAAQVLEKGGHVLSPRGEFYSSDNIRERLNIRDFKDTLRASGIDTGGPPALNQKNRNAFAGHLDKLISKYTRT
jgi:uncharacterized protein YaiI (UPF0178 family)